ncbi:tRNA-splicing endonuclease subunit Sen34, partial [Lecanoromycetidae sp. Uapishka_2]
MPAPASLPAPEIPFPINQVSEKIERYLLFDIELITWLRQTHNILGVLIGTLPQIPQQNVFLGLPLELQPEEARLLVEKGLAYIVDDRDWHTRDLTSKTDDQVKAIRKNVEKDRLEVAREFEKSKKQRTQKVLDRMSDRKDEMVDRSSSKDRALGKENEPSEDSLFTASTTTRSPPNPVSDSESKSWAITPTTSYPPLSPPPQPASPKLPHAEPASYALFKHLHNKGYFMSPGIRFGCQFSVYPGDPLRFHSHFLSMSYDWDEEIDLLDLVGGGRLGTGVKKGWLIGGMEQKERDEGRDTGDTVGSIEKGIGEESKVRTFCIEWGGM